MVVSWAQMDSVIEVHASRPMENNNFIILYALSLELFFSYFVFLIDYKVNRNGHSFKTFVPADILGRIIIFYMMIKKNNDIAA